MIVEVNMRSLLAVSILLSAAFVSSSAALAQDRKVGTISDLKAWKNLQGPDRPSLHVIGRITAMNACFDSATSFAGLSKSNPPIYIIKVDLVPRHGMFCIQVEGQERDIDFRYDDPNYTEQAI
jgi:hypothetical protein